MSNQIDITQNSLINQTQNTVRLSENESMKVAANIKMDMLFYLIEQYNKGIPVVPITYNTLITKYNLNENVAKNLELEINKLLENYVQEKEYQKGNYNFIIHFKRASCVFNTNLKHIL